MIMDTVSFEMSGLILTELTAGVDDFLDVLTQMERTLFEDGYYKNGPTIVELKPSQFDGRETQDYRFYVPANNQAEDGPGYRWVESLKVGKALRCRVPFNEGLQAVIERMKRHAQEQGFRYEDRVYLVMTLVYNQYWVDFLIPHRNSEGGDAR